MQNYAIELKEEFVLEKEKEEVREFIQEQIRKEYIQLLKSLQIVLVFFVGKKNKKKKKIQDYQYLNKQIVKNIYPLPLISDIIENIRIKKMFMKIDLR